LRRFPNVGRQSQIIRSGVVESICDPHGGLIFISLNKKISETGTLRIKIKNAYISPHFQLGVSSVADWTASKAKLVPWTTIVGSKSGLIVETTAYTRTIADPTNICKYYDDMFNEISQFADDYR
jgi:hypothetical protein